MLYTSKGKISAMSEVKSGTSESGYQWQNMNLTLEIPGFQGTSTKQVFRVSGDSVEDVLQFKVGDRVEVSWSMYAREYNGKMYNNVDLVKISLQGNAAAAAQKNTPVGVLARQAQAESLNPQDYDDLPFGNE